MFGYVRMQPGGPDRSSFRQYQGLYCTLCRRLGHRYGLFSRLLLNYDMTFFLLMQTALSEADPAFSPGHCSFCRRCKRLCCDGAAADEAADLTVLLAFHKCRDNAADSRGLKRLCWRTMCGLMRPLYRKAAGYQPQAAAQIDTCMQRQAALERSGTASADEAADPFATLLATLLSPNQTEGALWRFGYCLGRWVYLADAVDDLPEDAEKGRYNPLAQGKRMSPLTVRRRQEQGLLLLNACLAECKGAYDRLPVRRFDPLLRHILYAGMPGVQQELLLSGKERRRAARRYRRETRRKEA